MNRTEFQDLAHVRLDEARAMMTLTPPRSDGAYYLAGYAVECALKAIIAKRFGLHEWPDKKFVNDCHTHNLQDLVRHAALDTDLKAEAAADKVFEANWRVVKDWSESSRYERHSPAKATKLIDAVGDPTHGVLQWIVARW